MASSRQHVRYGHVSLITKMEKLHFVIGGVAEGESVTANLEYETLQTRVHLP